MSNYEYYIKLKDIAEQKGREHSELIGFFVHAAEQFEKKAKSLKVILPVTADQKKMLKAHGVYV